MNVFLKSTSEFSMCSRSAATFPTALKSLRGTSAERDAKRGETEKVGTEGGEGRRAGGAAGCQQKLAARHRGLEGREKRTWSLQACLRRFRYLIRRNKM